MENTFKHKVHKGDEGNAGRGLNGDHGMVMVNGEWLMMDGGRSSRFNSRFKYFLS
jgi:hypothetical protein